MVRRPLPIKLAPQHNRFTQWARGSDVANVVNGAKKIDPSVQVIGRPLYLGEGNTGFFNQLQRTRAMPGVEIANNEDRFISSDPRRDPFCN